METWRVLPHHAGSTDLHFRLVDALTRRADEPTVWTHSGDEPALLIGSSQTSAELSGSGGMRIVQRQSGGTTVLTGSDVLGIDVFLPRGHRLVLDDVTETYRWFGETWINALEHLGIEGRAVSVTEARGAPAIPERLRAAVSVACFGTLSPWEVVANGRKLIGLAQVRRQPGVLLQSAVHLHFDAPETARLLAPDCDGLADELSRRAIGLDEVTDQALNLTEVISAFSASLVEAQAIELNPGFWTDAELAYARVTANELKSLSSAPLLA